MKDSSRHIARYVMIGGFLGAGKTTAVARLARHLSDRGLRVGLICNDQSSGLVDTALLRATGLPVEEITGGCFCCRFNSLLDAAAALESDVGGRRTPPDVFLAEPVGSCTDLVATVSYPLRRIYGDRFAVAPLSVLVDPRRAARVLGLDDGRSFSEKVVYVYRKQLEEADIIVVNKCDDLADDARDRLVGALTEAFPRAEIHCCSAKDGTDVDPWFERVLSAEETTPAAMDVDYDVYADGEALLGWLNCTVRFEAPAQFDANAFLVRLASDICRRMTAADERGEIAHLKMTLDAEDEAGTLAVVSMVNNEAEPDLREAILDRVDHGTLVVNLRAEADPQLLERVTREALAAFEAGEDAHEARRDDAAFPPIRTAVEHLEQLRPGRPVPTHRLNPLTGEAL